MLNEKLSSGAELDENDEELLYLMMMQQKGIDIMEPSSYMELI